MEDPAHVVDIRRLRLEKLTPWERNPRQIDPDALAGLEASIREFGLVEPACGPVEIALALPRGNSDPLEEATNDEAPLEAPMD